MSKQNGPGVLSVSPVLAYMITILLFIFQSLNFFDKLSFGVSALPIMHEYGLNFKQFGLIGAVFFLCFAVGGTFVGIVFSGRFKPKHIIIGLALVWTISQLPIAMTHSLYILIACRLLLGLGEGGALAVALTAAYEWFPAERRNFPNSIILQGISYGFLIGGPFLSFLVHDFGWRSCFLACGLLSLVWLIVYAIIARDGPYARYQPVAGEQEKPLPFRVLWFDRSVIGVSLVLLLAYWVVGMAAIWLPPFLRLALGYKTIQAGWIISAIYIVQSPILLLGGWLSQYMNKRGWNIRLTLGWGSGLAMLVSGTALILAVISAPGILQIIFLALAFSVPSLTTIFCPVILSVISPVCQRARLMVVLISVTSISAFFSTLINGWIIQAYPDEVKYGFSLAFGLGGVVLLIGSLCAFFLLFPEATIKRFATYKK